jgi:hypothetical protein
VNVKVNVKDTTHLCNMIPWKPINKLSQPPRSTSTIAPSSQTWPTVPAQRAHEHWYPPPPVDTAPTASGLRPLFLSDSTETLQLPNPHQADAAPAASGIMPLEDEFSSDERITVASPSPHPGNQMKLTR